MCWQNKKGTPTRATKDTTGLYTVVYFVFPVCCLMTDGQHLKNACNIIRTEKVILYILYVYIYGYAYIFLYAIAVRKNSGH